MPKPDAAHLQTDKELAKLEKRIAKIYKEAADDLQKTIDDYFAKFAKRDAKQKARLEAGEITEQEYKQWRLAQMGRGERFKALQSRVAERYTEANETAVRYVNDATPGIYSLNRNYSAYTIEKVAGNVGFDLWDEQTVKRLIVENPEVMPYYPPEKALKRGIDLAYGKKQISASVTSSILQGKSIPNIAKDLRTRIPDMNKSSAIRTARTAVTGAQNAGRMDSYVAAEKMGIKVRKEWLATIDGRTRHSHAMLDGQAVDIDKPFKVDGEEIMFPGDTSAPGYLVYNCFVGETQIASDSKIVRSYKHTYNGDLIEVKTACGINFTCTPNHPILTPCGWVAAALLHNGDNLVVTFDRNTGSFRRNSNIKHIHSSMKALYNSLHCFGLMSRDSTLRINFHGDIPTTNVEVITKKWLLRNNGDSGVRQSINKFSLKNANKPLLSQCPLMKHFRSVCKAALRFISGKCQTLALLWRSLLHPNVHRFRTVSGRDIGVTQDTVNNLTAKSETLGKVLDGFSGEIAVDKVVSVKIIPSGQTATHVYNLQTQNGYYFVNSSIAQSKSKCNGIFAIAKNCRCTLIAAVDGVDTSNAQRRVRNPETGKNELVSDMTYSEWAGWKEKAQVQKAMAQQAEPPATTEDAIRTAHDLGVKYAQFEKMPLEQVNNAIDAVRTLPKDCVPKVIASGKYVSLVTGRPLGRKADQWWGVTYDYRDFSLRTMYLGYDKTDFDGGLIVGLNTQKFKTLDALTKAKKSTNDAYFAKTGRYWSFNTDGKATAYHEIGHCFADVRGLPKGWEDASARWAEESACDLLKKPDEAFAEAWAAYHLGDKRLPDYISAIIGGLK